MLFPGVFYPQSDGSATFSSQEMTLLSSFVCVISWSPKNVSLFHLGWRSESLSLFKVVDNNCGYISQLRVYLLGVLDIKMAHRGVSSASWPKIREFKHTSVPSFEIGGLSKVSDCLQDTCSRVDSLLCIHLQSVVLCFFFFLCSCLLKIETFPPRGKAHRFMKFKNHF